MSALIGREVRFTATPDGLAVDSQGEISGSIVDCACNTVTVRLPDGSHVVLPVVTVAELRDDAAEPSGGAGGSAVDG